jgi:SAM-dependent methyltransferase
MEVKIIESMAKGQSTHWWWRARSQIISSLVHHLFKRKNLSILEIGSGTGACIAILKQYGTVTVIEPDPLCRQFLSKKFNINAIHGSLPDDLPLALERYDLICLFDVLEHIDDDKSALEALKNLLAPNGRIIITVPAYQWLWSTLDTLSHHKRRYNAKQVYDIIDRAGLNVARLSYFNCILLPVAITMRKYDKLFRRVNTSGYEVPNAFINWVFKLVFSLEKFILPKFNLPCGLSIFAVLKEKKSNEYRIRK